MFIPNKLHHLKYTQLLLRHFPAIDSRLPQVVHFTKEVQVLKHIVLLLVNGVHEQHNMRY